MRTTVAQAKNSRIAESINIIPSDPRFLQYLNEATERLLKRGKYWGSFGRFALSVDAQLITLPPYLDTIEAINIEHRPMPLRSQWFEFLAWGYGTRDQMPHGSGIDECILRGTQPTFKTITEDVPSKVCVACDVASDVGKEVRILGYDSEGNWVRSLVSGIWYDGEVLLMAQGLGTASTITYSRITDIQPPEMDGQWWLFEGIDSVAGTMIGHYEYWETSPSYQVYLIPFINTTITTVEVMAKLAFRPVVEDTDYLLIGNLSALKLACMACKAEEEHSWGEANFLWEGGVNKDGSKRIGATQLLDQELQHYCGDGQEIGIRFINSMYSSPVEPIV